MFRLTALNIQDWVGLKTPKIQISLAYEIEHFQNSWWFHMNWGADFLKSDITWMGYNVGCLLLFCG